MVIKWCLYIALSAYCILDYFHTIALIGFGMSETNPVVLWIIGSSNNWDHLLYVKATSLVLLGILLINQSIKKERMK